MIFISYSHKDEEWKDRLVTHLGVSQSQGTLQLWEDRRIEGGEDWYEAITQAIDAGNIAILLVSANSLTSSFILKDEVPRLLQKRDAGKMRLYPVIIKPCNWKAVEWLKKMNLRPTDGRPLGFTSRQEVTETQIDLDLVKIAEEIDALVKKLRQVPPSSHPVAPANESPYVRLPTLPPPRHFVGRKELLDEIEKRLRADHVIGLVSLKGSPGVGKSALALEAAYRFGSLFPDGRFWMDLRSGDASNALRVLLRDLGIAHQLPPDAGFDDLCWAARNHLNGSRALLILDNAETTDAETRSRLAELCATTIITSRVAIDPTQDIPIDRLLDEDALKLLASRGVDIAAERDDALKLTARLGGLALALEITAKRMATHKPRQTCAAALIELNSNRHLVEALRLPRHQNRDDNLGEAFALSYRTLDEETRAVFHAIGLCAQSGAPVTGLAAMLGIQTSSVRDSLFYLAELSLADFDGARVISHPLLHDYAEMCARQDSDHTTEMIELHVRHFGGEIGGAYQKVLGNEDGQDRELKQIDAEIDNIRLAQIRALEDEFADPELALEVTDGLEFYWRLRDEPEIFDWLCRAQGLAKQVGSNLGQADVLKAIGDVQSFRKEMDAALSSYDAALKLFKQVGDNLGQANVLKAIGDVQSFRKEMDAALSSYDAALKLFKQVGSNLGQANVLLALARTNRDAGHYEAAIRLYEKIGDRYSIARGKAFYGNWLLDQDEREKATPLLLEAKAAWQQIGFEPGVNWMDELLSAKTGNADN